MITETGRVVSIESDCLWVETIQRSTCEACSAKSGCGQRLVAQWDGNTNFVRVLLDGRPVEGFQMHDLVTIGIPERVVANGSLLVYLTPLIMMLLALGLAHLMVVEELTSILSGLAGLLVGGTLVRGHSYLHRNDVDVQPVVVDDEKPLQWCEAPA